MASFGFQTCYNLFCIVFTYAKKLICRMFEPTRLITPSGWIRLTWQDLDFSLKTTNSGDYLLSIVCIPKSQSLLCACLGVCPSHHDIVCVPPDVIQMNAVLDGVFGQDANHGNGISRMAKED